MRLVLAAALLAALASPAAAQRLSAEKTAEIQALLDTAVTEHRVFVNCMMTFPTQYELISTNWADDVAKTIVLLAQHRFDPEALAKFAQDARLDALTMRKQPFGDVVAFCRENEGWERKYYEFNYVGLTFAVPRALED